MVSSSSETQDEAEPAADRESAAGLVVFSPSLTVMGLYPNFFPTTDLLEKVSVLSPTGALGCPIVPQTSCRLETWLKGRILFPAAVKKN